MSERLEIAIAALRAAEAELTRVLHEDYPVGAPVRWSFVPGAEARVHTGKVIQLGYEDRLEVRDADTDAVRWIVASYIRR